MITSVTTNYPVVIKNELWEFSYKKIKEELFFWYKIESWLILAEAEKALLDYLYYNWNKIPTNYKIFRAVDKKDFLNTYCIPIYKWFQSERFDNLDSLDWEKIKSYSKKFNKIKLNYIVKLLKFYKDSEFYEDYR